MEINTKYLLIGSVVLLAIGAAVGYYEAPTKKEIKTEIKTVETEVIKWKEVVKEVERKDQSTIIIETILPDGTIHRETRIVDKGTITIDVSKSGSEDRTKTEDKTSSVIIESAKTNWSASLMASPADFSFSRMTYGLTIERRIVGPFKVGVFGLTNNTFGATIGMGF